MDPNPRSGFGPSPLRGPRLGAPHQRKQDSNLWRHRLSAFQMRRLKPLSHSSAMARGAPRPADSPSRDGPLGHGPGAPRALRAFGPLLPSSVPPFFPCSLRPFLPFGTKARKGRREGGTHGGQEDEGKGGRPHPRHARAHGRGRARGGAPAHPVSPKIRTWNDGSVDRSDGHFTKETRGEGPLKAPCLPPGPASQFPRRRALPPSRPSGPRTGAAR